MSAGRKDGRSFRSARSSMEEEDAMENAVQRSTRYKNKWAVEVLKQWQYYRAQKGQASDGVDVAIQSVNNLLKQGIVKAWPIIGLYIEVVNKNGERYPSRSLCDLVAGLKRYFGEKNGSLAVNPLDRSDKR